MEAMLKDSNLDAGEWYPREGLVVGDAVLATDVKDSLELCLLEPLQLLMFGQYKVYVLQAYRKVERTIPWKSMILVLVVIAEDMLQDINRGQIKAPSLRSFKNCS